MTNILNEWVCTNPFEYIDIQGNGAYVCCPSWAPTNIGNTGDLLVDWQSPEASDIRKSVLDGSYSHCNKTVCPSLSKLIGTGQPSGNFIPIVEAKNKYANFSSAITTPKEILFGFDRSCNLKCPSCRSEMVHNDYLDSPEHMSKMQKLESIDSNFSMGAEKMMITGSGDPFYSKLYREYLINFDASKYPNIKEIQIITNGNLLTEKMWHSLQARPYIKTIEISIDAGTKNTYEQVTRLNGNWDQLMTNLEFISGVPTIDTMIISMVVSEANYHEMELFYNLIVGIFKNSKYSLHINFRQLVYWGTGKYSIRDITNMQVFESSHPKFDSFMLELHKVSDLPFVSHNFHHLL